MQEDPDSYFATGGVSKMSAGGAEEEMLAALARLLGLSDAQIRKAGRRAEANGSSIEEELIATGLVEETSFYRAVATLSGLRFLDAIPDGTLPDHPAIDIQLQRPTLVRLKSQNAQSRLLLAPSGRGLSKFCMDFRHSMTRRQSSFVTTPSAIRKAVWAAGAQRRVEEAVSSLYRTMPQFSARTTFVTWQAMLAGFVLGFFTLLTAERPATALTIVHASLTLIYTATIWHRLKSLLFLWRITPDTLPPRAPPALQGPLPVYSVMVALHREAEVIEQLLDALSALDWPASRLDIKLVCEADDEETLEALARYRLPFHMEIVRVPPYAPRTKPKALDYALRGVRGEFVTIYDAEDRPHPGQLREAYRHFLQGGEQLACVQAPLQIDNEGDTWLSTLFAAEYHAQFHGFLPMLAKGGRPLPLGGTSNHFRRKTLIEAGAWDPFNVTEDADLGLRLARLGHEVTLITLPTLENAPTQNRIWINQRSRWLKGFLQTFLVSCRDPLLVRREIGLRGLASTVLTSGGTALSALLYPFFFLTLALVAWRSTTGTLPGGLSMETILIATDGVNMLAGYGYYAAAVVLWHRHRQRRLSLSCLGRIPFLWMLLTLAAWKALWELIRDPHRWNKTPHVPVAASQPHPPFPSQKQSEAKQN